MALSLALAASSLALLLAGPAPAFAQLSWTGPVGRDIGGNGAALTGVACPSTSECVAVDINGGEMTFNPGAPAPSTPVNIDSSEPLAVTCLSTTSCVAVDVAGGEVTFNPQDPAAAQTAVIDSGQTLTSVACPPGPSATMPCVAVDGNGNEVTFNTIGPVDPTVGTVQPEVVLTSVVCPAQSGCVVVGADGTAWTFDPQTGSVTSSQTLDSQSQQPYLTTVTCTLTSTECLTFDDTGTELGFFSGGGTSVPPVSSFDPGQVVIGAACPDGSDCIAVDSNGGEISFTPSSSGISSESPRIVISPNFQTTALSCPATNLCVAVDAAGHEISFDPTQSTPVVSSARIDGGSASYAVVSCPSTTQCTAIDSQGYEATFNPTSSALPSTEAAVDPNGVTIYSISCPSTSQCTAVDLRGQEVTFNPQNPGSPTPVAIVNNQSLLSVSCPSTTQCTAVDDDQYEATFNPQAPTTGRYASLGTQSEASITSVSCPTVSQCTAVDAVGEQATFNPQNPGTPKPTTVLGDGAVAVSCPTVSRCVAIDPTGLRVTFDPTDPALASSATIDSSQPSALDCPGATFCVAIDAAGHAVEFDPGGSGATAVDSIGSGGSLNDLACVSAAECVTVDSTGHAYLGEGPVPLAPVASAPPRIAGVLKQGDTLQETHGTWSGPLTSYAYQWERCTNAASCVPIVGATGQSYKLVAADTGHLIRVSEQAADAGGVGAPAVSAATAKVTGLPAAPSFSRIRLTGIAARRPSLQLTLTGARYGPKLRDWTLSLSRSLSVHLHSIGPRRDGRWRGVSIRVNGEQQRFSAHLTHGALVVGLKRTVGSLRISIGGKALTASKSLVRSARRHKPTKLGFKIAVRSTTHKLLQATATLTAF